MWQCDTNSLKEIYLFIVSLSDNVADCESFENLPRGWKISLCVGIDMAQKYFFNFFMYEVITLLINKVFCQVNYLFWKAI